MLYCLLNDDGAFLNRVDIQKLDFIYCWRAARTPCKDEMKRSGFILSLAHLRFCVIGGKGDNSLCSLLGPFNGNHRHISMINQI